MPNSVGPTAQTQAIWSYILNLITTENAPGKRLAGIKDVRKSIHFWTGITPAIGVQPKGWRYVGDYGQRRRYVEVDFLIAIAVATTATPATSGSNGRAANLDDALAALQVFLDDGNGNGFEPIVHDPANLTLGQLCTKQNLEECMYDWQIRPNADQRLWAYGVYQWKVETIVTV